MTAELLLTTLLGAGFLGGVGTLLHFFNTRRGTRDKTSADAYGAYQEFVTRALADAGQVNTALLDSRSRLNGIRARLIDLVQALIVLARHLGASEAVLDRYIDELDDIRAL